jgi:hypothetical protein
MNRQTLVIVLLALTVSIGIGFLIGQLAGGNSAPVADWTPAPTVIGTPVSPVST